MATGNRQQSPDAEGRGLDAYERDYMVGAGRELRREKTVWRWHWVVLGPALWTLLGAALTFAGALPGSSPAAGAAVLLPAVLLAACWALFVVLRVVVTEREVLIQYGLWGPRIAADAIEACRVTDYDWKRFGGWGIKRASDGTWAYSLMGEGTRVVEIVWRDGAERRSVVVSSRDPEALVASIQEARAASGAGRAASGVRVDAAGADATAEADAPREAADRARAARR